MENVISEEVGSPAERGHGLDRVRNSCLSPGASPSDDKGNSTTRVALLLSKSQRQPRLEVALPLKLSHVHELLGDLVKMDVLIPQACWGCLRVYRVANSS